MVILGPIIVMLGPIMVTLGPIMVTLDPTMVTLVLPAVADSLLLLYSIFGAEQYW